MTGVHRHIGRGDLMASLDSQIHVAQQSRDSDPGAAVKEDQARVVQQGVHRYDSVDFHSMRTEAGVKAKGLARIATWLSRAGALTGVNAVGAAAIAAMFAPAVATGILVGGVVCAAGLTIGARVAQAKADEHQLFYRACDDQAALLSQPKDAWRENSWSVPGQAVSATSPGFNQVFQDYATHQSQGSASLSLGNVADFLIASGQDNPDKSLEDYSREVRGQSRLMRLADGARDVGGALGFASAAVAAACVAPTALGLTLTGAAVLFGLIGLNRGIDQTENLLFDCDHKRQNSLRRMALDGFRHVLSQPRPESPEEKRAQFSVVSRVDGAAERTAPRGQLEVIEGGLKAT